MAKAPSPTFKNDKAPGGLANVGWSQGAMIKLQKKMVGNITAPSWRSTEHHYKVRLMVHDAEGDGWHWVTLGYKGESLEGTKAWIKEKWPQIAEKWKIRQTEPWY